MGCDHWKSRAFRSVGATGRLHGRHHPRPLTPMVVPIGGPHRDRWNLIATSLGSSMVPWTDIDPTVVAHLMASVVLHADAWERDPYRAAWIRTVLIDTCPPDIFYRMITHLGTQRSIGATAISIVAHGWHRPDLRSMLTALCVGASGDDPRGRLPRLAATDRAYLAAYGLGMVSAPASLVSVVVQGGNRLWSDPPSRQHLLQILRSAALPSPMVASVIQTCVSIITDRCGYRVATSEKCLALVILAQMVPYAAEADVVDGIRALEQSLDSIERASLTDHYHDTPDGMVSRVVELRWMVYALLHGMHCPAVADSIRTRLRRYLHDTTQVIRLSTLQAIADADDDSMTDHRRTSRLAAAVFHPATVADLETAIHYRSDLHVDAAQPAIWQLLATLPIATNAQQAMMRSTVMRLVRAWLFRVPPAQWTDPAMRSWLIRVLRRMAAPPCGDAMDLICWLIDQAKASDAFGGKFEIAMLIGDVLADQDAKWCMPVVQRWITHVCLVDFVSDPRPSYEILPIVAMVRHHLATCPDMVDMLLPHIDRWLTHGGNSDTIQRILSLLEPQIDHAAVAERMLPVLIRALHRWDDGIGGRIPESIAHTVGSAMRNPRVVPTVLEAIRPMVLRTSPSPRLALSVLHVGLERTSDPSTATDIVMLIGACMTNRHAYDIRRAALTALWHGIRFPHLRGPILAVALSYLSDPDRRVADRALTLLAETIGDPSLPIPDSVWNAVHQWVLTELRSRTSSSTSAGMLRVLRHSLLRLPIDHRPMALLAAVRPVSDTDGDTRAASGMAPELRGR
jgi:hypothetical protein